MPELLRDRAPDRRLRRGGRAVGRLAQRRRGPVARAARPQRHGQDHAGQLDRRRHPLSRRHHPCSTAATSPGCGPTSAPMPASAGCRRSATSSSRSPSRRTSPRSRGPAAGRRAHLRAVPAPARAARQSRQPALRRRAADAGDRPRPDPQSAHPAARRAARRPGADPGRGIAGGAAAASSARRACRRSWSSRTPRRSSA